LTRLLGMASIVGQLVMPLANHSRHIKSPP
jgi:hypothetical protein